VVTVTGKVWALGQGSYRQLGDGTELERVLPASEELSSRSEERSDLDNNDESVVVVCVARAHTACSTEKGMVWTWGCNHDFQLEFSDGINRGEKQ